MRIALLSDLHANLPALAAALRVAERALARRVIVAGDVVGGGPHPSEVVGVLRSRGIATIRGNVDRKVVELAAHRARASERLAAGKGANLAWTALRLAPDELEWLAALPGELELAAGGVRVRVVHGSPAGEEDPLYPSLTARGLRSRLAAEAPDVLVCGHTHVPFVRRVAGVLVVNCGSVGRPYDGDPRGSLALLDAERGRARARIVRFAYDAPAAAEDMREREVPGVAPEAFLRGVEGKTK
ncbi:MAG TPA: metallophosphoesterase family protein [Thermoanaerobaculaceae bacterium]|nr:metallophosphoesterase family protein [Thermoanaerobaculaceae bacterium]